MPEEKNLKTNYASNSHKSKEIPEKVARPKLERVVTSDVLQPKKGLWRRITDAFSVEDIHAVGSYVVGDVVIPSLKTLIQDVVVQGIERSLFGEARPRSLGSGGMRTNYTSYNRMSQPSPSRFDEPRTISRQARSNHSFDEIILESRGEAEDVLGRLIDAIDQYDVVTVADLYDLVGLTSSFTDNKWGWNDLRSASIRRVRAGYRIELPRTMELD